MARAVIPLARSRALPSLLVAVLLSCDAPPSAQHPKRHVDLWPAEAQEALPPSKVTIVLDCAVIRSHPLGARVMSTLATLPEWKQFASGADLNPARDVDTVLVTGPSLIDARRDAVVVHYSARDADVERAILSLTSQRTGSDSTDPTLDVGIPAVRAWRLSAGGYQRVFLRGADQILVVAPAKHANAYARALASGSLQATTVRGEALSLHATTPGRSWRFIPATISEMRAWVVPRSDGGADLYGEGDCVDDVSAANVAADFERRASGAGGVVESRADGSMVKVHLALAKEQLEALFEFVMTYMHAVPR